MSKGYSLAWKNLSETVADEPPLAPRPVFWAMWRGLRGRCPACGHGRLFPRYVKAADACPHCGEALHHQRADDAPAYFTVFVTGHTVLAAMLSVEFTYAPPLWLHLAIFLPLTLIMSLALLPMFKGATIGLQWALYMHGFNPRATAADLQEDQPF
jgi:uncharacterized protein (DUF983 family)